MIYNITPCPKPRMTRRDKWARRPVVLRYFSFKDECRLKGVVYEYGKAITFHMPMPKSWSKKKKAEMNGKPHKQRPDIDNMIKSLFDSLYDEDAHIWWVGETKKLWAYEGAIEIKEIE